MTTGKFPTRREHPRVSVELEVTVAIADVRFAARTRDMSRAGLCLIAEQPLTRDAEISLELVLKFGDEGASEISFRR